MAKKKNGNNSHHHRHEHQSFFLIVAGGFLLLVLGYFLFADNPLRIASEKDFSEMTRAEKQEARREKREAKREKRKKGPKKGPKNGEKKKAKRNIPANLVITYDYAFYPPSKTVKAGSTVTFSNSDTVTHTIVADNGSFRTKALDQQGASDTVTLNTPGTYTYYCEEHPEMRGTIVVTE